MKVFNTKPKNINSYVNKVTFGSNTALLLLHAIFGVFFKINQVDYLYDYNCISIAVYLLAYIALYKHKTFLYIAIVYLEIFLFMLLTVISLGWNFGFQQYCFGFVASLLFTDFYVNKKHKMRKLTICFIILNIFVYTFLRIWTYRQPYLYTIKDEAWIPVFFITNSLISFGFLTTFFCIYSSTVFRLEQTLLDVARKDPLTGLSNRRGMQDLLSTIPDCPVRKPFQMCIAMIDIDYFKQINDTYGHDAGDQVLKALADVLLDKHAQNEHFHVCRWGGEEFFILYKKYKKKEEEICAEFNELRHQIEQKAILFHDTEIKFTITIGLAFYANNMAVSDLIKKADNNLYIGKDRGKNVVIY